MLFLKMNTAEKDNKQRWTVTECDKDLHKDDDDDDKERTTVIAIISPAYIETKQTREEQATI